jgi:oligopeptide transport system substrate-binding protein
MLMRKLLLFAIIGTLFASCSSDNSDGEIAKKKIFRYNEIAGITSLDPAAANNLENIWAVNQLFNGLVQLDDSLIVRPCIAKRWTLYDDGREYTFHLRTDVYFHDDENFEGGKGRKVTASDFVKTFQRLYEHKSEHSSRFFFKMLDMNEDNNNLGCSAPNDSTFKIFLKEPFPPLLEVLTMHYFVVVPWEIAAKLGEDFRVHPVGTGPFRFKVWDEGVKLVLIRNENYFEMDGNVRLPYLDAVSISFIKDKESLMAEFLSGSLDMISGADAMNRDMVLDKEGSLKKELRETIILQKSPFMKTDYMGFLVDPSLESVKNSPLKNKLVRQAMNYALDKEKMIKYLRHNIGIPATSGFVPAGMPSFNAGKVKGYTYDPDKARQLLEKAGFPGGKGLDEIVMQITPQHLQISEYMEKQFEDVGFKVKINVNQPIVQREEVESARFIFFRKTWVADYADAENFLSIFYSKNFSPNGSNYFHFHNEKFDELYEKSQTLTDNAERYKVYHEMDNIIMDEAVVVPLYYDEVLRLVQKNIIDLKPNAMNLLNLKRVKKS